MLAIDQAIAQLHRQAVERTEPAVVEPRHAGNIEIAERHRNLDAEVFDRGELGPELVGECRVGTIGLAGPDKGHVLDLLLPGLADVGPQREAEYELGVDFRRIGGNRQRRKAAEAGEEADRSSHADCAQGPTRPAVRGHEDSLV